MLDEARNGCRCPAAVAMRQRRQARAEANGGSGSDGGVGFECTNRFHMVALSERVAVYLAEDNLEAAELAAAALLECFPTMPDAYLRFCQVIHKRSRRQKEQQEHGIKQEDGEGGTTGLDYRLLCRVARCGLVACAGLPNKERDASWMVEYPGALNGGGSIVLTRTQRLFKREAYYRQIVARDPLSALPGELVLAILRLISFADLWYVSLVCVAMSHPS